jgi:hypothetical protein
MTAKKIKLFDNQPPLEDHHIEDLTKRGFLVPSKSPRERSVHGNKISDEITNRTVGDVVSYRPLDGILRKEKPNQDDARRLLAIETCRPNGGPRHSHIARLVIIAFAKDKAEVINRIKILSKKSWAKKAK